MKRPDADVIAMMTQIVATSMNRTWDEEDESGEPDFVNAYAEILMENAEDYRTFMRTEHPAADALKWNTLLRVLDYSFCMAARMLQRRAQNPGYFAGQEWEIIDETKVSYPMFADFTRK